MYRIEKITDVDDNERIDGRYPLRKCCIINLIHLAIGDVMRLEYVKDNQGNDKSGYLHTSTVEDYEEYDNRTTVYTINSVYYLKKL